MAAIDKLRAELRLLVRATRGYRPEVGFKYRGPAAFVLANGQEYKPQLLPRKYRTGLRGACFDNAYRRARFRGLVYVEGYAFGRVNVPILHAWCVEPGSDLVLEVTWDEPGTAYLGVPFRLAYCKSQGGTVLDHWEKGWPVLRAETAEEEWRHPE